MTFDEWMLTKDKSYVPTDDSMSLRLLRECWFSRDAEVAELKNQLADNNLFDSDRNQWRNNYRRTISDLTKERDQLREQVAKAFEAGRQAEREECTKVCEKNLRFWDGTSDRNEDYRSAHNKDMMEIRARGDTK